MHLERDPIREKLDRGEFPGPEDARERQRLLDEAREKASRERKERFDKENTRRAWIQAGNPEETFDLNWPSLQNQQELERAKVQQQQDATLIYSSVRNVF